MGVVPAPAGTMGKPKSPTDGEIRKKPPILVMIVKDWARDAKKTAGKRRAKDVRRMPGKRRRIEDEHSSGAAAI